MGKLTLFLVITWCVSKAIETLMKDTLEKASIKMVNALNERIIILLSTRLKKR